MLAVALGALALAYAALAPPTAQAITTWQTGDVFAGVANGKYRVFDNNGNFKEQIDQGVGNGGLAGNGAGFTTGCAFNPDESRLYTTNFTTNFVVVFNTPSPHQVVQNINTTANSANDTSPESIVFRANGEFFVGHATGAGADIHLYDAAGNFIRDFDAQRERVGTDWIELSADQNTIFYTSEGRRIMRYDTAADAQLPDFAVLPGVFDSAFALRLLPPGNGSGGLLVADRTDIHRLDGAGNVVQTYDATGENGWFSLNLDPNGTSFWAGSFDTNRFYRFNIATGAIEVGPIASGGALFGLCLKGEPTAAEPDEADKEVTGLILDDGSGFPDSEGRPLNCREDETQARTTRCSMVVEVSTNPIISVVSLEQNNGPDRTDSAITFLASNDDGHTPAHVEGAFIRDAGSPAGSEPDLLTCFSLFNPDNPLEQQLNPCPHDEKNLGDGRRETAESDLHFQLVQEPNKKQRILRFYKLHCLVGGEHSITFYNKAEVKDPTEDPNLDNNWWRAILDLTCVTPGKVTGGGKIEPDGTISGLASLLITSGANAGHSATFGFVIEFQSGDPFPTGNLEYNDHDADVRIKAIDYATLAIVGCTAEFTGTADVNGTMEPMRVKVFDGGEPGSEPDAGPDTFEIDTATYDASGVLIGGNIQIHNGNPC